MKGWVVIIEGEKDGVPTVFQSDPVSQRKAERDAMCFIRWFDVVNSARILRIPGAILLLCSFCFGDETTLRAELESTKAELREALDVNDGLSKTLTAVRDKLRKLETAAVETRHDAASDRNPKERSSDRSRPLLSQTFPRSPAVYDADPATAGEPLLITIHVKARCIPNDPVCHRCVMQQNLVPEGVYGKIRVVYSTEPIPKAVAERLKQGYVYPVPVWESPTSSGRANRAYAGYSWEN